MENNPVTFLLTERAAYWIGYPLMKNFEWQNRDAPDKLKEYIGDGTKPDRMFTVTLKARYILDMVKTLMLAHLQSAYDDYRAIILNLPNLPGYTGLQAQMVQKANAGTEESPTAQWLIDQYNAEKARYKGEYDTKKSDLIAWANN